MRRVEQDASASARLATSVDRELVVASGQARTATGQRTIRPFRPLPSGRAVVGGLLITLAALGAFVVTGRDVEDLRVPYLVAATDLSPGHILTVDDLQPELLDLPSSLAASSVPETAEADLVGAVVLGPVGAGELFQRSGLTPPSDASQVETAVEFSFSLPEGRAPRSLRPGEHVAMLSTVGRDRDALTTVVVANAVVTDFSVDDEGFGSNGDVIVTLAISGSDDVLSAVNAAQATDVTILRIPADGSLTLPRTSAAANNDTESAGPTTQGDSATFEENNAD